MMKCLKVTFSGDLPEGFLRDFVLKQARKLSLEGTAQAMPDATMRIMVCGHKNSVDQFLDLLHKGEGKAIPENIEIEPFVKDRDFRGVFRVIE